MLLYLSVFTILISFVLLIFNWRSNRNMFFLSCVFILTSLFGIGHYFITSKNSTLGLAIFFNHFAPLMFLIGPFVFFYVRNTLADCSGLHKNDWIHFVPTIIATIGSFPYLFLPFENKLQLANQIIHDLNTINTIEVNLFYTFQQSFGLRTLLVFVYLLYCFYLLWKYYPSKKTERQNPKKQYFIIYRWLVLFLSNMLFICISFTYLALNAGFSMSNESISNGYLLYIMAGFAYSLMSFSLLLFPEVLYGIPRNSTSNLTKKKKEKRKTIPEEDPFFELSVQIQNYLQEKKPYLKFDFTMSTIAIDLKIPQNQVAYCITHLMNINFSKLKTKLRIAHAIELLESGTNSIVTIEAIGKQSGFKTRSNFYSAFKKEIGITPSEYVQNMNQ